MVQEMLRRELERVKGIEPSSSGWEPGALPLSYTRRSDLDHTTGQSVAQRISHMFLNLS